MLSDDIFRNQLHATANAIERWLTHYERAAVVEVSSDAASWRVNIKPHAANACPVELILRIDQCCDLMIGAETYEELPIGDLGLFPKLLQSVADGGVVTRTSSSSTTGVVCRVETIVDLGDGSAWTGVRQPSHNPMAAANDLILRDRHYVAYARSV